MQTIPWYQPMVEDTLLELREIMHAFKNTIF